MPGIDTLRKAVNVFNNCNESFNDAWTAEQLLAIYRAYQKCGWDITPDQWEPWQVQDALQGKAPIWDANERPVRQ
jgi:hypothetical protein